jgi:hypothetical protein
MARIPGWGARCRWSKTCWRRSQGTRGLGPNCGRVAKEVQVADFLCDDAQLLAGVEALYLSTEDLAEGNVFEVERSPVGNWQQLGSRGQLQRQRC